MEKKREKMEKEREKMEKEYEEMKKEYEEMKKECEKMKKECEKMEKECEKMEKECEKMKKECEKMQKESEKTEKESEKKEKECEKKEKECEKKEKLLHEFLYTWRVENVHLCWQKTGESLKSPIFEVEWMHKSSFNLCLYPKSISGNGNYISYYLGEHKSTASKGSRTDLYILAADGSKIQPENSEGFLSMKKNGMLGYSKFISWKTLWDNKSNYLPDSILTLCCRIWSEREMDTSENKQSIQAKAFARTQIRKDVISKLMVIESVTPEKQKIGEIKLIMQDHPIAIFSASFDKISCHKSLTIDINATQNDKILMSTFKLVLIDAKRKKIFWKKTYPWNNNSNLESIVLTSHFSQDPDQYVPNEMFNEKFILLDCRFTFTTGCIVQKSEKDDYGTNLYSFMEQPHHSSKKPKQYSTTADALMNMYLDETSHDIHITTKTSSITAHEMVLCNRSSVFSLLTKTKDETTLIKTVEVDDDIEILKKVVYFLYTDIIQDINWEIAVNLYSAAVRYDIDLLKHKCRNFIKTNLEKSNIVEILLLNKKHKDEELHASVRNFIAENELDIFNSSEWSKFMKSDPNLAVQIMLSKYQLK